MIKDLNEINRVLFAVDQNQVDKSIKREKLLYILRNSPVISQSLLDHEGALEFCRVANLIREKKETITFTPKGQIMLKLLKKNNPDNNYDITKEQCEFLNSGVFFARTFPSPIKEVLKEHFVADDEKETWTYDYYENPPLPDSFMEYMPILKQSTLIIDEDGVFEINKKYAPTVSNLISDEWILSPEVFADLRQEQKEVGEIAEEKVLEYEKEELLKSNCMEEASLVKRISIWNVAAGFDIKSFSGPSRTKHHDKFIEVKGSKAKELRFYWSINEVEKARKLKDKYWLYFVPNVYDVRKIEPIKFQNPIKKILLSDKFRKRCIRYEITLRPSDRNNSTNK